MPSKRSIARSKRTRSKRSTTPTRAYFNNTHDNFNNVWHFPRELNVKQHTTPKPIGLVERAIKSSLSPKNIVLDFFLGSGTTLIAAEQLGRVCYGQELDEKYMDVIVRRWVKYMMDNEKRFAVSRNGRMLTKEEVADLIENREQNREEVKDAT